ncbi:MAG TPA: pitrilysin family protein [Gemmatimonadaceae bacterium]|nr:pitrilysin family protein [Gemmatimonadaceae bacterium]
MDSLTDPSSVQRTVLTNGLTVVLRVDRSAPVVAIVTLVKAGYFDETDDVVGIAHVLEHMFFKGTPTRGVGEIAKQTKASGGYLNAHTIYDNTTYFTVLPASGFLAGLDIQADAYANSSIDAAELKKELEVIIQEAKRKADTPEAVAVETLHELIHDTHRIRRWRIGREDGLRTLTRDDLVKFYRNFYRPSNTILSIVGDVDGDAAMQRITELYGSLTDAEPARNPGPTEPEHKDFRFRELNGDIAQTQITFGWRTPRTLHEDSPALDVIASILGAGRASRLYRALRERQLASSVQAYNYTPTELGVFTVHAETKPEKARAAAIAIADQMRALREQPVPAVELERVRRIFDARWVRRLETMEGQANHFAEWEMLGGWETAEDYRASFLSVTSRDVQRVANEYLDVDRAGVILYRPSSSEPIADSAGSMKEILDSEHAEPLEALPSRSTPPFNVAGPKPKLESKEAGVSVYRARSGLPILVKQKPGAQIAHLGIFAFGGSRDEPEELSGITTLVARSMLKGTRLRSASQLAEDVEMLGGSISAGVSMEGFGWTISVPVGNLAAAAELVGDVVQHSSLGEDAVETERIVALADVAAMRDDMFRYPVRLAMCAAFKGHPYAISTLGTEKSLQSIPVQRVRDWYRARVLKGTLVAGIVGDVDESAAAIVAQELGSLAPSTPLPLRGPHWPNEVSMRADSREKAQTALAIAFPGPARADPDRFAARIIAGIGSGLGGRFFDELRDRQSLAYTVHAYTSEHQLAGVFMSYIATSPEKEDVARAGLLAEFERLRTERVTDEELERAKRYAIGTHAIRQESGGAVLGDMIDAWMLGSGLRELEEHDALIESVSADDVLRVAREHFDPSRRAEGVVRGVSRTV